MVRGFKTKSHRTALILSIFVIVAAASAVVPVVLAQVDAMPCNPSLCTYFTTTTTNSNGPRTPIKHIIFLIQENHSFDNLFGTFPNLPSGYDLNSSTCIPYKENQTSKYPCEKPFNADNMPTIQAADLRHGARGSIAAYDNGKMDGFYQAESYRTMSYYDGNALPVIWNLASYYSLNYNFFSSAISYSEPNHLFTVAADTPAREFWNGAPAKKGVSFLNLTFPQIGEELTQNQISWGYYQYNWNDAKDCTGNYTTQNGLFAGSGDGYWEGLAQFRQVQNTNIECSSLLNINDFENALKSGSLPAVSWVIPEPSVSDHPAQSTLQAGQQYVSSVINMIEASKVWNTSVTFYTQDDYGGYYDGVVPVQLDRWGNGFREPLIAISPYSIPSGIISGPQYNYYNNYTRIHGVTNQEDFSAFLSTVEYNWNLKNLTDTDGEEPNLFYMLNFAQIPQQPLFMYSNISLVTYPYTTCQGCRVGTPFQPLSSMTIQKAQYAWTESIAQALAYSGNGDPAD